MKSASAWFSPPFAAPSVPRRRAGRGSIVDCWISQLTACFHLQVHMSIYFLSSNAVHPLGGAAMHPIESLVTRFWGLLRLAGNPKARRDNNHMDDLEMEREAQS